MNRILQDQTFEMKNVLSYRAKMTQNQFLESMNNISLFMKENSVKKNGYIVTSTFSIENTNNQQIMDIEILIPIDKEIVSVNEYKFKKIFKLTNAVKIRHDGKSNLITQSGELLMKYISDNGLTPITTGYNVTIKEPISAIDDIVVDIYIGITENIL
jgi:effector-binding domain-containing protein